MTSQQDLIARLPELPEARIVSYQTDSVMRKTELRTYSESDMKEYGRACYEAAAKLGRVEEPVVRWEVRREEDRTFPREYKTEAEADEMVAYVTVNPPATKHPLYIYTRPQLPAGAPEYDRELIASMLDDIVSFNHMHGYSPVALREQAKLLLAADNRDAEGVHTAKREDGVPDGWVLVPREPTPEMLRAGFLSESEGFDIETPADAPGLVYRAMLAAAPQPDNKESR